MERVSEVLVIFIPLLQLCRENSLAGSANVKTFIILTFHKFINQELTLLFQDEYCSAKLKFFKQKINNNSQYQQQILMS